MATIEEHGTAGIIGNEKLLGSLKRALENGELPHTLLLTGPTGVGKTTILRSLIPTIVDLTVWKGPIEEHPDVWIDDEEGTLGIAKINGGPNLPGQALLDFLNRTPYGSKGRVVLIAQANRLTDQAANALLKTLEEPPPRTYIFLAAPGSEVIPDTVVSRATVMKAMPVATATITSWLMNHGENEHSIAFAALRSRGRPGIALQLFADGSEVEKERSAVELLISTAGLGIVGALTASQTLTAGSSPEIREKLQQVLNIWESVFHDVVSLQSNDSEILWEEFRKPLELWAAQCTMQDMLASWQACHDAVQALDVYAQPRLALDILCLKLFARSPALPAVGAL